MTDLTFGEIKQYQRDYSKKHSLRLEVELSTDCDLFTVTFGMEAWGCILCSAISNNSFREAWESAKRILENPKIETCDWCGIEKSLGCSCEDEYSSLSEQSENENNKIPKIKIIK